MSKELVSNWYQRLSIAERNLPLLIYQGNLYTPQATFDEVMRGSPLGDALQRLLEQRSFGTTPTDEQTVAKLRLTEIMRSKPDKPLFATLSNKVYTPSQLLEEIQQGTSVGQQWVSNEISHMKTLVSVR